MFICIFVFNFILPEKILGFVILRSIVFYDSSTFCDILYQNSTLFSLRLMFIVLSCFPVKLKLVAWFARVIFGKWLVIGTVPCHQSS